jgi:hypothetical protein
MQSCLSDPLSVRSILILSFRLLQIFRNVVFLRATFSSPQSVSHVERNTNCEAPDVCRSASSSYFLFENYECYPESTQGHSAAGRIKSVKNAIGNGTRHLAACSAVCRRRQSLRTSEVEGSCGGVVDIQVSWDNALSTGK